jgi:hypothetical protein
MEFDPHFSGRTSMWRAFFLATGVFGCILGAQCLVVDSFVMASDKPPTAQTPASLFGAQPMVAATKDYKPPEWAPWTLLSTGAVVILYSLTLNKSAS